MQSNVGIQHSGVLIWTGSATIPRDIRKHTRFAFVFEVFGVVDVDTVFQVQAHNPSPSDNCVAGAAFDVDAIATCANFLQPGPEPAQILIPANTPIGTVCSGTIPCRPGAFLSLAAESGDTQNVRVVLILDGPRLP